MGYTVMPEEIADLIKKARELFPDEKIFFPLDKGITYDDFREMLEQKIAQKQENEKG